MEFNQVLLNSQGKGDGEENDGRAPYIRSPED